MPKFSHALRGMVNKKGKSAGTCPCAKELASSVPFRRQTTYFSLQRNGALFFLLPSSSSSLLVATSFNTHANVSDIIAPQTLTPLWAGGLERASPTTTTTTIGFGFGFGFGFEKKKKEEEGPWGWFSSSGKNDWLAIIVPADHVVYLALRHDDDILRPHAGSVLLMMMMLVMVMRVALLVHFAIRQMRRRCRSSCCCCDHISTRSILHYILYIIIKML